MAKKSKRQRRKMQASHNDQEQQLQNRRTQEGFALPHEFKNWQLYFFSHRGYLREFTRWMSEKMRTHGGAVKIETDMTPHSDLERKIHERRARNPQGSQPAFRTEVVSRQPKYMPVQKKSRPAIEPPSGTEGAEHAIF